MKVQTRSKEILNVLIKQNVRNNLSEVYQAKYQEKYPSFSVFIENVLLVGLAAMEE